MKPLSLALLTVALTMTVLRHMTQAQPISYPTGDEENLSAVYASATSEANDAGLAEALSLDDGPQIFIDDYLIAKSDRVSRRVNRPQRDQSIPNPIITGARDGCIGPYVSVIRDPESGRYRIWYNAFSNGQVGGFATMESSDGVQWERPHQILKDPGPLQWGCSVVDRGPEFRPTAERYKLVWWANGGMMAAASAEGLDWKLMSPEPVIRHDHDITSLYFDPIRQEYLATMSTVVPGKTWTGSRRVTIQSSSKDLKNWSKPWYALTPLMGVDEGDTQFYAMDGYLARGELLIGMAKILRDDLRASDTPEGSFGVGSTALTWSRDGRHWTRDPQLFFEPDPRAGSWDHAHAWIDEQLLDDDVVRFYYGGYKNGHKVKRESERQIGLVTLPRDRYVARAADASGGVLRTKPFDLRGRSVSLNADIRGELRARLLDANGAVIPEFDFAQGAPVSGDSLEHPLRWKGNLARLAEGPVSLELSWTDGEVFAFGLGEE